MIRVLMMSIVYKLYKVCNIFITFKTDFELFANNAICKIGGECLFLPNMAQSTPISSFLKHFCSQILS